MEINESDLINRIEGLILRGKTHLKWLKGQNGTAKMIRVSTLMLKNYELLLTEYKQAKRIYNEKDSN